MQRHKSDGCDPNSLVSKKIKGLCGYFEHEIIDTLWCETKREGTKRERFWQDDLDPSLNEVRAFVTKEERKEQNAAYQKTEKHKVRVKKNGDVYRAKPENKERLKKYSAAWHQKNKVSVNQRHQLYNAIPENKKRKKEQDAARYQKNKGRMAAWMAIPENKKRKKDWKDAWYQKNKERLKERVKCECGSEVSRDAH